jgi:Mrp family chromosome partitioning ATPase
MFGATQEQPMATSDNTILPIERYGIKLISMGSLLDDTSPAILRGPMVTRATQQFLRQVDWSGLDYLILDLPPGTGDIQLTIVQTVALSGAVIVTTPQEVALIDARKASTMFAKVNVPVLGLVENMSFFVSPSDGKRQTRSCASTRSAAGRSPNRCGHSGSWRPGYAGGFGRPKKRCVLHLSFYCRPTTPGCGERNLNLFGVRTKLRF